MSQMFVLLLSDVPVEVLASTLLIKDAPPLDAKELPTMEHFATRAALLGPKRVSGLKLAN